MVLMQLTLQFLVKIKKESKMTPSLASFIASLAAGGFVVTAIAVALVIISKSDRINRI